MEINEIFSLILMGAASLLCIALIFYFNKITKSIAGIEENITGLSAQIQPVINNITEMSEKLNTLTEDLKEPVSDAVDIISKIKDRVDIIFDFEEKIRNNIASNLSGIASGVKTFWNTYKSNGKEHSRKTLIIKN